MKEVSGRHPPAQLRPPPKTVHQNVQGGVSPTSVEKGTERETFGAASMDIPMIDAEHYHFKMVFTQRRDAQQWAAVRDLDKTFVGTDMYMGVARMCQHGHGP